MALSDRQRDRIVLGLDPENQPPDMDEPVCAGCGVVLTGKRSPAIWPLCWVCREAKS